MPALKDQHILVLEDSSKVELGGGQRISLATIETLCNAGADVTVMDYSINSVFGKMSAALGANVISYDVSALGHKTALSSESSEGRFKSLIWEFISTVKMARKTISKTRRNRFNHTYSATKKTFFLAVILTCVSVRYGSQIFHLHSYLKPSIRLLFITKLSKLLKFKVIVPSVFMQHYLANSGLSSIVVPNFIENFLSVKKIALHHRKIDVLFVGGDQVWKGASRYQNIIELIIKKYPHKSFVFKASGYQRPTMFSPPIQSEKVTCLSSILNDVKIVIFPSQSPESFCISAVEAQAAGCAIVYNPIGAFPEVIGGYALARAVSSNRDRDYADALMDMIEKVSLLETVSNPNSVSYSRTKFEENIFAEFNI